MFDKIGSSLLGGVTDGLGSAVQSGVGSLFGSGNSGPMSGSDYAKWMDEAFPGTNAWERLGGSGSSAGVSANTPMQTAKLQAKTQKEVASINANAQRDVANIQTQAPLQRVPFQNDLDAIETKIRGEKLTIEQINAEVAKMLNQHDKSIRDANNPLWETIHKAGKQIVESGITDPMRYFNRLKDKVMNYVKGSKASGIGGSRFYPSGAGVGLGSKLP